MNSGNMTCNLSYRTHTGLPWTFNAVIAGQWTIWQIFEDVLDMTTSVFVKQSLPPPAKLSTPPNRSQMIVPLMQIHSWEPDCCHIHRPSEHTQFTHYVLLCSVAFDAWLERDLHTSGRALNILKWTRLGMIPYHFITDSGQLPTAYRLAYANTIGKSW